MPTYDYECPNGHRFELFHSISDDKPKKCPECGKRARRVPAAGAGLLFKGSGFYITDYRSSDYKERAKSEGGGAKSTEGGSGGGKEAGGGSAPAAGGGSKPASEPKKRGKKDGGAKS